MTITYLDTSAAMKLLVEEPESEPLAEALTAGGARTLVASWLLHTELHCAAGRRAGIDLASVAIVLGMVDLVDLSRGDMIAAAGHAPLRSNDAIHLAVAVRLGVDELVTYDAELIAAATRMGIRTTSPQ